MISMQEACRVLVGSHDFSSFRAAGCQVVSFLQCCKQRFMKIKFEAINSFAQNGTLFAMQPPSTVYNKSFSELPNYEIAVIIEFSFKGFTLV